jgi:hypothetical protein
MVAKKSVFKVVANGFFYLKNGKKWFALARLPMNTKNKTIIVVLLLVFSGDLARANHFQDQKSHLLPLYRLFLLTG